MDITAVKLDALLLRGTPPHMEPCVKNNILHGSASSSTQAEPIVEERLIHLPRTKEVLQQLKSDVTPCLIIMKEVALSVFRGFRVVSFSGSQCTVATSEEVNGLFSLKTNHNSCYQLQFYFSVFLVGFKPSSQPEILSCKGLVLLCNHSSFSSGQCYRRTFPL